MGSLAPVSTVQWVLEVQTRLPFYTAAFRDLLLSRDTEFLEPFSRVSCHSYEHRKCSCTLWKLSEKLIN